MLLRTRTTMTELGREKMLLQKIGVAWYNKYPALRHTTWDAPTPECARTLTGDSLFETGKTWLYRGLKTEHLKFVQVQGDGNCFFRSMSVLMYGNEEQHIRLRFQALMHMLAYVRHYDINDIDRTA